MSRLGTVVACCLAMAGSNLGADPPQQKQLGADRTRTTTDELPRGNPEAVGMSAAGLQRIGDVVQQYIDAGRIEGAVVGVSRRNQVVYMQALGVMEEQPQAALREDAIFIMASSSKPVLGVAAMILFEEGMVSLQDPVEKYIPEFKGLQVAVPIESADKEFQFNKKANNKSKEKGKFKAGFKGSRRAVPEYRLEQLDRPLTIHHLLTHTAGLGTGGLGTAIATERPGPSATLASWVPKLAARPLDFQPGTRWAYSSGDGLKVVGRIIEIVSGMPLNEFIQSRIFDPLEMQDTHWNVPADKLVRMPGKFRSKAKGTGAIVGEDSSIYYAGMGLFSTARDYLHFEQMLVNGGTLFGHRILKPESVAMLSTNQVGNLFSESSKGGPGQGFGYTVAITLDPQKAQNGRVAGSFGWGGAGGTSSWATPSKELAVVFMVHQPTDLPRKIAAIVREAVVD